MLPTWKDLVLRHAHANFIRFRKPTTERVREIVVKAIPQVRDTTRTAEGIQLYDTARKAFDNMRNTLMVESRKISKAVVQQLAGYDSNLLCLCPI